MSSALSSKPIVDQDARAALTSRVIPMMTLSKEDSQLTAPLPSLQGTALENAASRFAIEGNAIVTGGAGTLALAASRALLEHGLEALCLVDLTSTLQSSASEIQQLQADFPDQLIFTAAIDVTAASAVQEAFASAASRFPHHSVDILCCFAGIVGTVSSESVTPEAFRKVIDVNLTGSFMCAQAAAKYMIESRRGGSILFTASISAHHTNFPQPQTAYNVSKAGVAHMTRNLACEWAVHGIRVNSISPGYMDTILNEGDGLKPVREIWAERNPMGRMGAIEEITGPVVLLCSKRAGRYINGADLIVDGGAMAL